MAYYVISLSGQIYTVSGPFHRRATAEQAAVALLSHVAEAEIISAAQLSAKARKSVSHLEQRLRKISDLHPLTVSGARLALEQAETREAKHILEQSAKGVQ